MCESVNESWTKEEASKAIPEEISRNCGTSLMISQIDININPPNHIRRPLKAFHARGWAGCVGFRLYMRYCKTQSFALCQPPANSTLAQQ